MLDTATKKRIDDCILDPACGTAGFLISAFKHIGGIGNVPRRDKACLVSTPATAMNTGVGDNDGGNDGGGNRGVHGIHGRDKARLVSTIFGCTSNLIIK